jgi:uncharacterized DUF497 family protein
MEFEFDIEKSRTNKIKHGIDFTEAQLLWEDSERVEIPAKTEDEIRLMVIGLIGNKHWSAVITYRNDKTRIISARRSQREEIQIYES